jgi:hypothetical protein
VTILFLTAGMIAAAQNRSESEQAAVIDAVRKYALNYTNSLPDYTCVQVIKRTVNPNLTGGSFRQVQQDVVEEQLSFVDHREIHKLTSVNGKAVPPGQSNLAGTFSRGEFGSLLDVIFNPATGAELKWEKVTRRNGIPMNVIAFSVPKDKGYSILESKRTLQVPFKGLVYADEGSNAVLRIEMECFGIPPDSEYQELSLALDYKAAEVAGQSYILPAHYAMHFRNPGRIGANEADFKFYRKFSADAKITFDPDPQQDPQQDPKQ